MSNDAMTPEEVTTEWGVLWSAEPDGDDYEIRDDEADARTVAYQFPTSHLVSREVRRGPWTQVRP